MKKIRILLHGAVDSSNFGDSLFVYLFYSVLNKMNNVQVDFISEGKYAISEANRNLIGYSEYHTTKELLSYDVLVYISGGYFGDAIKSVSGSLQRYFRYFSVGKKVKRRKGVILSIGVGGGPLYHKWLQAVAVEILNYAKYVSVRDIETQKYFLDRGVHNIVLSSDTAQVARQNVKINTDYVLHLKNQEQIKENKFILLHATNVSVQDDIIIEKIIPAIELFLQHHQDFFLIVTYDSVSKESINESRLYKCIKCNRKIGVNYVDPIQMCSLINGVDVIVTGKLHVGILGATYGKSVVCFPFHKNKTARYYRQIDQIERSLSIYDVDQSQVYTQIEEFYDKPITLPDAIINQAHSNLSELEKVVKEIQNEE